MQILFSLFSSVLAILCEKFSATRHQQNAARKAHVLKSDQQLKKF
jgi:hypothetical protein